MATTSFIESGTAATFDLSFFNNTAGTVASVTDQIVTGPRSLKLSTGAGATSARADANVTMADIGRRVSYFWYYDVAAAAQDSHGFVLRSAAGQIFQVQLNTNSTLNILPAGTAGVNGSYVTSVNTWYWIVVAYYITNSTTFAFKLYLHDTSGNLLDTITANTGTLTRTTSTVARFNIGSTIGANRNVWFANFYIDDGASSASQPDFSAPVLVTAKRPVANGTTNNFVTQIGSGGSGYGTGHSPQVNERPLSTTNGWSVVAVGSAVTEEYNIENQSTGDVDITSAPIVDYVGWIYTKALASETVQLRLNNVDTGKAITTSPAMYTAFAGSSTYPAGTGTDIGEVTDTTVTTVSLYECGVVVAFTPAPSGQPTMRRWGGSGGYVGGQGIGQSGSRGGKWG